MLHAAPDYGDEALRSTSGLDALRFQKTDRLREPSTRNRADGASPLGDVVLPSRNARVAASLSATETETVAPHCERLPYHSTAPPSRR